MADDINHSKGEDRHAYKPKTHPKINVSTDKNALGPEALDKDYSKRFMSPMLQVPKGDEQHAIKRRNTTNFAHPPLPTSFNFLEELKRRQELEEDKLREEPIEIKPLKDKTPSSYSISQSPLKEMRRELENMLEFKENIEKVNKKGNVRGDIRVASFQHLKILNNNNNDMRDDRSEISIKSMNVGASKGQRKNLEDYAKELESMKQAHQMQKSSKDNKPNQNWTHGRVIQQEQQQFKPSESHPTELDFKEGYISFMPMEFKPNKMKDAMGEEEERIISKINEKKNNNKSEEEIVFNERKHTEEGDSSDQKRKLDSDIEVINNLSAQMKINSEPEISSPSRRIDRRFSNIGYEAGRRENLPPANVHRREPSGGPFGNMGSNKERSSRPSADVSESPLKNPSELIPVAQEASNKNEMIIRIKDSSEDWRRSIKYKFGKG
jgi:hypothetical protein